MGETNSFTWKAEYPGLFAYHCGTSPMIQHVANGMFGVVIVDPQKLMRLAREYVLVQSEFYPDVPAMMKNGASMSSSTAG